MGSVISKQVFEAGISQGYRMVPCDGNKRPLCRWKDGVSLDAIKQISDKYIQGIALTMGNDWEAIDFDLKYDTTGQLYEDFIKAVNDGIPGLLDRMLIQKTINGGFHWIYKCFGISKAGNTKLARRPATEQEKALGDKVKVLIETRGVGGYIMIPPTNGYKFINGKKLGDVEHITKDERDFLFEVAKSFNTYDKDYNDFVPQSVQKVTSSGISPLDDYDNQVTYQDTINLLVSNGWTQVGSYKNRIKLKRPGETKSLYSGYYEIDKRRFSVFSTSTEFKPETRYKDSAVYAVLECDGDFHLAAKRLSEKGYGKSDYNQQLLPSINKTVEPVITIGEDDDLSKYLVNYDKIWESNEAFYDGKIIRGFKTGMPEVDFYFRFRKNALYTITAKNNTGKTSIVQFMQVLAAKRHGFKWLIWTAENSEEDYAETLLTFYLNTNPKEIRESFPEKYQAGKKFVEEHFFFLEEAHNLEDVLIITKAFYEQMDIYGLFVDPINSTSPRKAQENWDYTESVTAGRKIKNFTKKYCSVWISIHPRISAQRDSAIPKSVDGEFGAMINKADFGIVLDRNKEAIGDEAHKTYMKIDKVREKKLGGNITPDGHFIELYYHGTGFTLSAPRFNEDGTVVRIKFKNPLITNLSESSVQEDKPIPVSTAKEAFPDNDDSWEDFDIDSDVPF